MKTLLVVALLMTSAVTFAAEKTVRCSVNAKNFLPDGTLDFDNRAYKSFEFSLVKRNSIPESDTLSGDGEVELLNGRLVVGAVASFSNREAGHNGIRIYLYDNTKKIETSVRSIESRDELTLEYSSKIGRGTPADIDVFAICSFKK